VQIGILTHCWWECKLLQPLWKAVCEILTKLEIKLPYDPVISLLDIYPKVCETGYCRDSCTSTFIAKLWKQLTCPTIDDGSRNCGIDTQ
jgi:hypothetical protein